MSKTRTPAPNPHRTPSTKHPSPDGIPARSESNAQPYPMIFLNWIDPPIGLTLNNVSYKVSLMNVGVSGGGQSFIMPYAEQVAWNPLVTPSAVVQYQLTSTLGTDPGQDYYETMTLTQASGALQTIRSRVFVPPQSQQFTNVPTGPSVTGGSPPYIRVSGVTTSANLTVSVLYLYFQANDQYGPPDLFLQQPW